MLRYVVKNGVHRFKQRVDLHSIAAGLWAACRENSAMLHKYRIGDEPKHSLKQSPHFVQHALTGYVYEERQE